MSSGSAHRGRRDNGLDAAEYAAAGDVDPRVGEHLLDVLAVQGIAAYLQPAVDLNPVTRSAVVPARPTDRLFVDRAHLTTARDYLAQLAQPGPDRAVDDAWAEIMAGYDTEVDSATAPWPEAESLAVERPDGPDAHAEERDQDQGPDVDRRRVPPGDRDEQPSLLLALDTFGADLPGDPVEDEGYTPPPPPPLPRISKYAVAGVLAIIAGFIVFLKPSLLPIDPDVSMVIGFVVFLAGFAALVWRLRPGGDDDDYDPDDGARV